MENSHLRNVTCAESMNASGAGQSHGPARVIPNKPQCTHYCTLL